MSANKQETQLDNSSNPASMVPTSQENGLSAMQKSFVAAMAPLQSLFKANAEIGAECTHFLTHRLQAHADYWKKFAQCKDVGDFAKVQSTFLQSMTKDYSDEAASLISVTGNQVQSSVEMLHHTLDSSAPPEGKHVHH
jgi:Phasin protein